ncbi:hypothetical protein P873_08070 [Arenimonas composti TR7-09 = DSM 18010]|uniref:Uncharacterized protein n=1 Tax=Arenimonas composti TR7-09 = DSM 18010 TaxID=1121013 RepID=A0A091C0M5_9GAMM|nr:hypothetical protein P873_08070 [Arenimonas composti TR7-09 = DSM 18010]
MHAVPPTTTLEVDEHPGFERRFHRVQRVGWALLVLLVAAALLGLTGSRGPFARAIAAGDGVLVDHPRFARHAADVEIVATIEADSIAGDRRFALELSGSGWRDLRMETIAPQPRAMRTEADALILEFDAGTGDQVVRMHVLPTAPGVTRTGIGLAGRAPARLRSLVWP